MPTTIPRRYKTISMWVPDWVQAILIRRALKDGYTLIDAPDGDGVGILYAESPDEPDAMLVLASVVRRVRGLR